MGTTTSPGPCRYHCGSRVNVGASVSVGDGGMVAVSVGINVCVAVVVPVCVGSGLNVQVGSIITVGEGGTRNVNPPHPTEISVASPRIKYFFK